MSHMRILLKIDYRLTFLLFEFIGKRLGCWYDVICEKYIVLDWNSEFDVNELFMKDLERVKLCTILADLIGIYYFNLFKRKNVINCLLIGSIFAFR